MDVAYSQPTLMYRVEMIIFIFKMRKLRLRGVCHLADVTMIVSDKPLITPY